jgi:cytochrome P450
MQRLTLRIILRTVFGVDDVARLEPALIRLMARGGRIMLLPLLQRDYGPGSPQRQFEQARAEVDAMLFAEIARRRESPAEPTCCRCFWTCPNRPLTPSFATT